MCRLDEDQDGLVADESRGISRGPIAPPAAGWLAALAALGAYAWWGSGAAPFRPLAYIVVGLPAAGALWVVLCRGEGREAAPGASVRPSGTWARRGVASPPWTVRLVALLPLAGLAAIGIALEALGLAHGGRAVAFPTLSDVADEAIRFHAARAILLALWLLGGVAIVRRRMRRLQRPAPAGHPVPTDHPFATEGPVPVGHPVPARHATPAVRATPAGDATPAGSGGFAASKERRSRR